jgi:hypothetical protein
VTALPFAYTVIAKPPDIPEIPEPEEIPGYSPAIMILLAFAMFAGIIFVFKRKNLK